MEASGGLFEVTVDGELAFSKRASGCQGEQGEVMRLIEQRRTEQHKES